jgi:hypothetical protein
MVVLVVLARTCAGAVLFGLWRLRYERWGARTPVLPSLPPHPGSRRNWTPNTPARHPSPQAELADVKNYNFDAPSAFDTPALLECVAQLKAGHAVEVPTYDFSRHARGTETKRVRACRGWLRGCLNGAASCGGIWGSVRSSSCWAGASCELGPAATPWTSPAAGSSTVLPSPAL